MKFIRIFLFILIIIGLSLLATQSIWVPKLVNRIILNEKITLPVQEIQPSISLADGRQCYVYNHETSTNEPYKVQEFIDITIDGTKVTGTKKGTQSGPDMTNGYTGTITGILEENKITAIFSYEIEGSKNKEEEIYKTSRTGIEKIRYPLTEEKDMLVPNTTKDFKLLIYSRVNCYPSD